MSDATETSPVRAALAKLVTEGASAVWLPEVQPLLELPAVAAAIDDAGPEAAVANVLAAAVEKMGQSQYRRLLEIVLELDPEYQGLPPRARREAAGREFRGGQKRVSPNTIRQYHEPRALDQLAATLSSSATSAATSADHLRPDAALAGPNFVWHPAVHMSWAGETRYLWRLGFSSFDSGPTTTRLISALGAAGVRSWAMDQTVGAYDVVIDTWIVGHHRTVSDAFTAEFEGDPGLLIESFEVVSTVWDERWQRSVPDHYDRSPPSEIRAVERGRDHDLVDRYTRSGLIQLSAPHHPGVGIVTAISPHRPMPISARRVLTAQLENLLAACELFDRSLLEGTGFAIHVLRGSVHEAAFSETIRSFIDDVTSLVSAFGCRATTMVVLDTTPVARAESLGGETAGQRPSARECLLQPEGPNVEVRSSARFSVEQWLREGETRAHTGVEKGLGKTVTAILNSGGGTVVIGAIDRARGETLLSDHGSRPAGTDPDGFPTVGDYLVTGIEFEMPDGWDRYQRSLLDYLANHIEPNPSPLVDLSCEDVDGRSVAVITIDGEDPRWTQRWFYFRASNRDTPTFYVRRGAQSIELSGVELDQYRAMLSRSPEPGHAN